VQVDATRVPLAEMPAGLVGVSADEYHELLALWLTRSPLTDLAECSRKAPLFGWSASTLSLIATAPGRTLAFRAVSRLPASHKVAQVLLRAAKQIPEKFEEARELAQRFAAEVSLGLKALGQGPAAQE
jgi:hypothetical protein